MPPTNALILELFRVFCSWINEMLDRTASICCTVNCETSNAQLRTLCGTKAFRNQATFNLVCMIPGFLVESLVVLAEKLRRHTLCPSLFNLATYEASPVLQQVKVEH